MAVSFLRPCPGSHQAARATHLSRGGGTFLSRVFTLPSAALPLLTRFPRPRSYNNIFMAKWTRLIMELLKYYPLRERMTDICLTIRSMFRCCGRTKLYGNIFSIYYYITVYHYTWAGRSGRWSTSLSSKNIKKELCRPGGHLRYDQLRRTGLSSDGSL